MNELANRGYQIRWLNTDYYRGNTLCQEYTDINENIKVYYNWEKFKNLFRRTDIYFGSWAERYKDLKYITPKYGVLYDSLDNFAENEKHEKDMLAKADVVFTTSQSLYRLRRKEHSNVVLCPNGCFPSKGNVSYDIPQDLKDNADMNKPIILFSGALAQWIDIGLLKMVAEKHQLVFVGKLFNVPKVPESFINLGCKTYDELQAYYQHCDITLLPFNRKQEAVFSDPIKTYESLAHGKICVSTKIEESEKFDKKTVYMSKSREHFMQNINKAINRIGNKDIERLCRKEAEKHSWSNRVDIIEKEIIKLVNMRENI